MVEGVFGQDRANWAGTSEPWQEGEEERDVSLLHRKRKSGFWFHFSRCPHFFLQPLDLF